MSKETVTTDDLERIFFRAQDEQGHWGSVSAAEATDMQFDAWVKTRMAIQGEDMPWSLEERASVCNVLWQGDALVMLKKETE